MRELFDILCEAMAKDDDAQAAAEDLSKSESYSQARVRMAGHIENAVTAAVEQIKGNDTIAEAVTDWIVSRVSGFDYRDWEAMAERVLDGVEWPDDNEPEDDDDA